MILTKKQILEASDIQTRTVPVSEWGGEVLVKGMSGAERDAFESQIVEINEKGKTKTSMVNLRAKLCALVIVDEKGAQLFDESEIDALGKKSASALQRVFDVARKLSGMTDEDVKELAKN